MHTQKCLLKNPHFKKLTRPAKQRVSGKIAKLIREGYDAKQAAAIAFNMEKEGRLGYRDRVNPIADKDVIMCAMSLLYIRTYPHMVDNIPDRIMEALISEGLWDEKSLAITQKGEDFLKSLEE